MNEHRVSHSIRRLLVPLAVSAGLILLGGLSLAPGRPGRAAARPDLAGPPEGRIAPALDGAAVHAANVLTVDFTFAPSPPSFVGMGNVEFTDVSTTTVGSIVGRRWDFGDGETLETSDLIIEHTYNTPGTFTVTLTVTDSVGNRDTEVKPELVRVRAERKNVTAVDFTFTPPSPRVGDVVTFTTVVTPSDATGPIHYTWSFGDTVTTTVQISRVQHTYRTYGTYTVELEVENLNGQGRATDSAEITVEPYRAYLPLLMKGG